MANIIRAIPVISQAIHFFGNFLLMKKNDKKMLAIKMNIDKYLITTKFEMLTKFDLDTNRQIITYNKIIVRIKYRIFLCDIIIMQFV